jgi:hypothetical protein
VQPRAETPLQDPQLRIETGSMCRGRRIAIAPTVLVTASDERPPGSGR